MNDAAPTNSMAGDVTRFTDVDLTPDARFFVEFMDAANALPDNRRLKRLVADRLHLSPDTRVLDVGCGTGDDARALASLVGETARVVGIDASQTMIDVARQRSRDGSRPIEFALGDALALDFPDDAFDACRCWGVLMHVDGKPARAVKEMVRVTRPGGRMVIFDFHWDAFAIDHPDQATTRTVVHAVCDGIRHGWIGSQLPRLMTDAGLTEIEAEGHAVQILIRSSIDCSTAISPRPSKTAASERPRSANGGTHWTKLPGQANRHVSEQARERHPPVSRAESVGMDSDSS